MYEDDAEDIKSILTSGSLGFDLDILRRKAKIFDDWEKVVGQELARSTRPREFKGKTLVISVENSSWSQEIHFRSKEITSLVNSSAEADIISRIKVVVGKN